MAYNTVYVWAAYETLGSTNLNSNMANLDYLKGRADRTTAVFTVFSPGDTIATGNGKLQVTLPAFINGMNVVGVGAGVHTVSSSGVVTVQIHNLTDGVDILSTEITIDANEYNSTTAATAAVINTSNDDVATADILRFDVDTAGTGAKGLDVWVEFLLS